MQCGGGRRLEAVEANGGSADEHQFAGDPRGIYAAVEQILNRDKPLRIVTIGVHQS